jgi:hypothetical protein
MKEPIEALKLIQNFSIYYIFEQFNVIMLKEIGIL